MEQTVLFDRYTLLEPAGVGGSAEVWRARDETTGEIVAVKRLHPVVFGDEAGRRRLQREFDALGSLDEPHIVRVRDLQIGEREAALVLDFVDGESLAQRLVGQTAAKPAVTPEAAASIVADVAAALAAAHAAGIVHRDVTPGNILLTADGEARLTDFGIAHASGDAAAVTATGLLMGTMRYLAPEQLRGGTSTPASDLHGLAAVTYEMLAGHPAYEATSPVSLAEAQEAGPAPIAGVPAALDGAVRRGLAVDPARRPADVGAFAASIEAAVGDQQTRAIPIDPHPDRTTAIPLAAAASPAVAAALTGDDVGVAVPSRAAASHGPLPRSLDADGADRRADPEPGRRPVAGRAVGTERRRRVPAPVALALGLAVAVAALTAASGPDRPFGTDATAADASAPPSVPSVAPKRTARPSPTPVPQSKPGKGGEKGKGHDGGNDD
ncbi:MAG TPA: serine/threonine-protein kinase [Patescibacteria group bacterium]|nr:serine/threonine-protein kinase [Patescibacteria group bacterium]